MGEVAQELSRLAQLELDFVVNAILRDEQVLDTSGNRAVVGKLL
jgi:hypothetical protein